MTTFTELHLDPKIIASLTESGYTIPTPIQASAIPAILAGSDIRASAQTGTGKTAAFLLPALHKIASKPAHPGTGPRILILVPTRELAMQVATQAVKYSKHMAGVKTVCIYGGAPYPPQNRDLARPYDILIATPGRLIDHMEQRRVKFSRLELLVLDEADRMLDMGFIKPVEDIAAVTPKERQTVLFSATLKGSVLALSNRLLNHPKEIHVTPNQVQSTNIEQRLHMVDGIEHKFNLLTRLLDDPTLQGQVIVFTSTKRLADRLSGQLFKDGRKVGALHGDMDQKKRSRTIEQLRQGKINILVATDVAARGIDVLTVGQVINFDLPRTTEDYVHRIGRTGRAGAKGISISFATHADISVVRSIERFTGQKIASFAIPGLEAKKGAEKRLDNKRHGKRKPFQYPKKKWNHHRRAPR